ncbi:MAG: BREX-1 system adenine-specific DNA-methyltransferase PglX [Planctomycetaceae bacterium]|jgi:type I restriction-modification system DNA methylase subunit|nr:BREX-1 system adenine-specific DNA-methyltransferase PglX [Planctomycetaceae bacterium]
MDTRTLKKFAVEARNNFISAVETKVKFYRLSEKNIPIKEEGDIVIIDGKPFDISVAIPRRKLESRIEKEGLKNFIESVAYTWFNRFVAIRYMEVHDYLSHGYRVFSHRDSEKKQPEILENAEQIELSNLDSNSVIEKKLDGNKDIELYQELLLAQCNALHETMPFLFEKVTDETELLIPNDLLHSELLVRKLVKDIDENLWQNIEIIGWLYQFYISDKKDEVIGKMVASEDIPIATQLFTPNWIVKYLVQNTLGKQWINSHPDSNLRNNMEYYIPSTNQEVMEYKQVRVEELKFLDPACGSGHILVEAYDLFKTIYLECGYRKQDIPYLILSKNLFGIEIDERAAQLAAFALMMKAAEDDKTILTNTKIKTITPNIITINESDRLDAELITQHLNEPSLKTNRVPLPHKKFAVIELDEKPLMNPKNLLKDKINLSDINVLMNLFKKAKTFGALIRIPETLLPQLEIIKNRTKIIEQYGDLNDQGVIASLKPIIKQTEFLAQKYDFVVTNPPYMGNKYLNPILKKFATENYPDTKTDLFAMFIERNCELANENGLLGFMTPFVWMFISSHEKLRNYILNTYTLMSLIRPELHAFFESAYVSICAFVLCKNYNSQNKGTFIDLQRFYGADLQPEKTLEAIQNPNCGWLFHASTTDFKKIPGSPIAYWVSEKIIAVFENSILLGKIAEARQGLITGDNNRFLRCWYEVSRNKICFDVTSKDGTHAKWFPHEKGGEFRRWYGNQIYVINWEKDGFEIKNFKDDTGYLRSRPQSLDYMFRAAISWSKVSSGLCAFRYFPGGFIFDVSGPFIFTANKSFQEILLCFCNTNIATTFLRFIAPTLSFQVGDIELLPILSGLAELPILPGMSFEYAARLIDLSKSDWDSYETSWNFSENPLVKLSREMETNGNR